MNGIVSRRSLSVLSALVLWLGRSAVADACTLAPYEDVFVPSGTVPVDGFAAEIGEPSRSLPALVDDTGAAVELVVTEGPQTRWTVRPAKALVPGVHYTFRYQLGRRFALTETVVQSIELIAGPSAPAPETAGTLHVQTDPKDTPSGIDSFHVQWDRAPALQAYASLLETHFLIDGTPASTLSSTQSVANVYGACDRTQPVLDSCGEVSGVPAGRHTITLTARVFGSATPLPTLTATIDVQCSSPIPVGNDAYEPGGGCAVGGGSSNTASLGIAAVVLGFCAVLPGRRRRS